MLNLGDFAEDSIVDFMWYTNDTNGGAISRSVDGTISVYKGNNIAQTVVGVTDTKDFDGITGLNHCRVDTSSDAFYETGYDYMVVLTGATIDSQSVNAVLVHFSLLNRTGSTTTPTNITVETTVVE